MMNITAVLETVPVVPLVQADDPAIAVDVSRALAAGGLTVAEVVFRTDRALECLRAVADKVPEMIAGAGTVLTADQAQQAIDNGARAAPSIARHAMVFVSLLTVPALGVAIVCSMTVSLM